METRPTVWNNLTIGGKIANIYGLVLGGLFAYRSGSALVQRGVEKILFSDKKEFFHLGYGLLLGLTLLSLSLRVLTLPIEKIPSRFHPTMVVSFADVIKHLRANKDGSFWSLVFMIIPGSPVGVLTAVILKDKGYRWPVTAMAALVMTVINGGAFFMMETSDHIYSKRKNQYDPRKIALRQQEEERKRAEKAEQARRLQENQARRNRAQPKDKK